MKKFDKEKYLRKLKLNKYKNYIYVGGLCLLVVVLGIYFAYSKYSVSKDTEVVRTTVGNFISGDIVITPYLNGEYSKEFPQDEIGINIEKVTCDNDAVGEWDEDNWQLKVTNLSTRTKCNVYFVTPKSCGINDNVSCINSRESLATLATEVNNGDDKSGKIYYLTSDIDLGGKFDSSGNALNDNISWTTIGIYNSKSFSGTFDGNGHIISNMYVNTNERAALFSYVTNATVKNLGIKNSYLKSTENAAASFIADGLDVLVKNVYSKAIIDGQKNSAGLVGAVSGKIINAYNAGSINSNKKQFGAGLVGYLIGTDSIIKNSYNYGTIASGGAEPGGIVGGLQGAIDSCYNFGDIGAGGGIVGQMYDPQSPKVYNSYNTGKVSGGIVFTINTNNNRYEIKNNFYLDTCASYGINILKSNEGAEPLSKDKMPSVISVINGDNAFVSDTNNINNGYPILKWQANR